MNLRRSKSKPEIRLSFEVCFGPNPPIPLTLLKAYASLIFMDQMNLTEFRRLTSRGDLIPLIKEIPTDLDTAVSAFLKSSEGCQDRFLLESVEGGDHWARYSFMGMEPTGVFFSKGDQITWQTPGKLEKITGNPLEFLREKLKAHHPVKLKNLPPFAGGFVGYLGYEMVRHMERLPRLNKPSLAAPDALMFLQEEIIAFDRFNQSIKLIVLVDLKQGRPLKQAYQAGVDRLHFLQKKFAKNLKELPKRPNQSIRPKSNTSKEKYKAMVKKAKAYIRAGDIFQVVLSQRWKTPFQAEPFEIYRSLRRLNPSPYLFYFQDKNQALTGSSPEVMVRLNEGNVCLRPIAGTRRRGRSYEDEIKMEEEMLNDPKEMAEHVMLLDLGRNDIGRVAKKGTVKVSEQAVVEKYSHVMHIVSQVEGKLKKGLDAIDVLKATFPAGTLSGAPKIRAMEIIEELETAHRGPYGGAVGYLDFFGNMDTAIAIRSIFLDGTHAHYQAGAGVVLDSKPKLEQLECENKARIMLEALKQCS